MKRAREEDYDIGNQPLDLLPRELWLNEIVLASLVPWTILDVLALSLTCKWFASELEAYVPRPSSFIVSNVVDHYIERNSASTLYFLADLKWPLLPFNVPVYANLSRECFARGSTNVFFDIAARQKTFFLPWLAYARNQEDVERFMVLSMDRLQEGRLTTTDFFSLLDRVEWTDTLLQWLASILEPALVRGKVKVHLPLAKLVPFLKAIMHIHVDKKNPLQCLTYMNKIWEFWFHRSPDFSTEQRHERHLRVKTTVALALEANYPYPIRRLLFEWPPPPLVKNIKPPNYSVRERLNILFGSARKIYALAQNAPASLEWLRENGLENKVPDLLDHFQ